MCYEAERYISPNKRDPLLEFIQEQDIETQDWIFAGIDQLEKSKGRLNNQNLETKHIEDKIFELKYKKLPIRILYAYHPLKRKFLLLTHGVVKKSNKLKGKDIKIAKDRYYEIKERR